MEVVADSARVLVKRDGHRGVRELRRVSVRFVSIVVKQKVEVDRPSLSRPPDTDVVASGSVIDRRSRSFVDKRLERLQERTQGSSQGSSDAVEVIADGARDLVIRNGHRDLRRIK